MPEGTGHKDAIRATRVAGTDVYLASGEIFGHVEDLILSKSANRILFAVLGRAGALTSTDNFYPVPWSDLDYDEDKEGYVLSYGIEKVGSLASGSAVSELIEQHEAGAL
jgi:sporulation protein YlmC with PRC-barrel domain